jgi:hypothetical protein
MSKQISIWEWIHRIRKLHVNPSYDDLLHDLEKMPVEQSGAIACSYRDLMQALDVPAVWQAGSLLVGAPLGDDGFEYFRSWVIWNGVSFYNSVLNKTDDILDCEVAFTNCTFEALGVCMEFLPSSANENPLASKDFGSTGWDWQAALDKIESNLPRLWGIYGGGFKKQVTAIQSSDFLDVPGLGILRVGDRVRHKMGYGEGVIVEIVSSETGLVKIEFVDGVRPFRVAVEYFSRVV